MTRITRRENNAISAESKRKVMEAILAAWINSDLTLGQLMYHIIHPAFGSVKDIYKLYDSEVVSYIVSNVKQFNNLKRMTG